MALHRLLKNLFEAVLPEGGKQFGRGTTVPTAGTRGYAKSAIFFDSDGASGSQLYINEGTTASCDFKVLAATVPADLDLGAAAAAGSLDVFSGEGAGRKLTITASNTGADNRSMSITNDSLAASRAYKIPDAGGNGKVVMTTGGNSLLVNANGADRTMSLSGNVSCAGAVTLGAAVTTVGAVSTGGALTTAAAVTFAGANAATITVPAGGSTVTLPSSGTLATVTGNETGTTADTFTVNSDGNGVVISSSGLTGTKTFTFPDATGTVVTTGATQTLAAKTLTTPTIAGGAITLSSAVTVTGTWTDLGVVTTADVNGGSIDGATVGAAVPSTGAFTTLAVGGGYGNTGVSISAAGAIQANDAITSDGTITGATLTDGSATIAAGVATVTTITDGTVSVTAGAVTGTWADLGTVTTVDIDGGSIDGTTIGAATPAAATVTTLSVAHATTPSVTTAAGKTNTGFLKVSGKTSGSAKLTTADATAQDVGLSFAAQTTGAALLICPDMAGADKYTAFGDSTGKTAVANLVAAAQDLMPNLTITAGDEVAHARTITIQARDAADNPLAERCVLLFWVNPTAEYGAPSATATDTFGAPSAGTIIETKTAKAYYRVITDATGKYVFDLTHNDAGSSRYITVEVDGKAVSSNEISFDAV